MDTVSRFLFGRLAALASCTRLYPVLCLLLLSGLTPVEAWSSTSDSHHATPVILDDRQGEYALGRHLAILEDPTGTLTLKDVMSQAQQARFVRSDKDVPSFGFSPSAYWLRVDLDRRTQGEQVWMLELGHAPTQIIDVYTVTVSGAISHQHGGSTVPMSARPYRHHKHVFPVELPESSVTTLWIRVGGDSSKTFSLRLFKADAFARASGTELGMLSVYAGIILGLLLYNAFLFLSLRERAYFHYVCFLATFLVFSLTNTGLIYRIMPESGPHTHINFLPFMMVTTVVAGMAFTTSFINTDKMLPGSKKVTALYWILIFISFGVIFTSGYRESLLAGAGLSLAGVLLAMTIAIIGAAKKQVAAQYYLVAWSLFLVGTGINILRVWGILPTNPITEHAILWGSAAEAILLSVGLAARMRLMKQETDAAWQLAINNEIKALQSERIASESHKKMIKQEQLATLGLLSASVAHEINNPNQFVSVSAQNLEKRINDLHAFIGELMGEDTDPEISHEFAQRFEGLHSQLALVKEGSQRISGIVNGMRNNSRHDLGEAQHFDPAESLRATLDLMQPTFSTRVRFEAGGLENGYLIKGYPARLNQVFTNLIVNACHAIESKQQQSGDSTPGTVTLWTQSASGMLAISIEDTGCGMTPEVRARLFEPFFTTKGADKGTGLGLGICRSIVEEHGGRLELESTVGRGTVFRVIVPLADGIKT